MDSILQTKINVLNNIGIRRKKRNQFFSCCHCEGQKEKLFYTKVIMNIEIFYQSLEENFCIKCKKRYESDLELICDLNKNQENLNNIIFFLNEKIKVLNRFDLRCMNTFFWCNHKIKWKLGPVKIIPYKYVTIDTKEKFPYTKTENEEIIVFMDIISINNQIETKFCEACRAEIKLQCRYGYRHIPATDPPQDNVLYFSNYSI